MKRFRVKAVGLGLALLTGSGLAAGQDWSEPGRAVTPAGAPALLPPSVRAGRADEVIWLPAREAGPKPVVLPAGGFASPEPPPPAVMPAPPKVERPQPTKWPPEPDTTFGPRLGGSGSGPGPLPAIPVLPDVLPPTVQTPEPPFTPAPQPEPPPKPQPKPAPIPPPRPVDPTPAPPVMTPPPAPEFPTNPLPKPRPVEPRPLPLPAPQPELHPAPPELMYPAGALTVDKHGTFGSPPIRLSRDYPPVRDLLHKGHHHDGITLATDDLEGARLNRVYVRGEYLQWWMPGYPTPVLATTNANTGLNGYLGESGTTALVGPGPFVDSTRSGFRLRAGLDDAVGPFGLDAGFFFLGTRSATAVVDPDRFPLITRPVFVPNLVPATGEPLGENGEAVAIPGILRGTLTVRGDSRLWGGDANLRKCLASGCNARAEWFVGYRHLNLRERLTITEDIRVVGSGGDRIALTDPIGTRVVVSDRFTVRNQFHGGQFGLHYDRTWGNWDLDARASVALGVTHQVLDINGFQVRQRADAAPMNFVGGLLGAGPNLGRFTRNRFSVAPELTLNLGYRLAPNLRVFAGYNFLLWTNVIRPGDQIDHVVDLTFVPNALPANFSGVYRPRPLFSQRDLVVNGIQFGIDWRW